MFRWGILSAAKIAEQQVLPAICQSSNGIVTALASSSHERGSKMAKHFDIPKVFQSYQDLIESDLVDGIYIPIATAYHAEWAEKAARAGKHVLCEKPIGMNADQISNLLKVREETGVLISEAFMVYYHPQWIKVEDLLTNNAIGRLKHINGTFSYHNLDPDNTRNIKEAGGGALPDIGVYPVITARNATGKEPKRIRAEVEFSNKFKTDTFTNATLDFGDFSMAMQVSTQMHLSQSMVFYGTEGRIEVEAPFNADFYGLPTVKVCTNGNETVQVYRYPGVSQYMLQVEAFVKATQDRKSRYFTLENSLENQKVIDTIFAAGKSESWETV